ncbi:MAG TPA: heat-inducible transcriptional repressor HrcA [Actinomycetota bacterium]|nr:heat-inducible transcriptional repressor HrcA [Actinomycetota bacterium]
MTPEKDEELVNDRRAAVLRAVVSHYVRTGEPAGSKTLVERYKLGVSPATVRNDMAALEDAGYISHPHTSAGRVPTDAGYRYVVDEWGGDVKLSRSDAQRVEQFYIEPRWALEDALRQTASLLSSLTHHAAVVFTPALDRSTIRHVEVIGLAPHRAMLIVVTDTGRVEDHVLVLDDDASEDDLGTLSRLLNEMLTGEALEDAPVIVAKRLEELPSTLKSLGGEVLSVLRQGVAEREGERVFLEGTSNMVDEQKFSDLETVRQVIGALEHRRLLLEVLAEALSSTSVSVKIGSENRAEEMRSCTVITAPYAIEGSTVGSLGIVGPTRMDYRRTIAAVYEVSAQLGHMLGRLAQ